MDIKASQASANAIRMGFFTAEGEDVNSKYMVAVKTLLLRAFMINVIYSLHTDHCSHSQFPVTDLGLFHLSSGRLIHKSKRGIKTANGKS